MFGAAINLTARIAPQAAGGQVLGTAAIAESARAEGVETMTLGTFELRNVVEPVELWDVALCSAPEGGAVDPVCRLHVARARAAGRLRHRALDYWFCSLDCAATFAQAPARYAP